MKIEKGKIYRTRDGRKVEVLKTDLKNDYPVIGVATHSNGHEQILSWCSSGKYTKYNEGSLTDIIGEWEEALDFDPYCLPKWADQWIAMDADGGWYCYSEKPEIKSNNKVYLSHGNVTKIQQDSTPKNYKGDWKDSLFNVEQLKINKSCQYK